MPTWPGGCGRVVAFADVVGGAAGVQIGRSRWSLSLQHSNPHFNNPFNNFNNFNNFDTLTL